MEPVRGIREFWDIDAATYDRSPQHQPIAAAEWAAWAATLARLLPPAPARVLDVGADTGFLSLVAARLGHQVSALDFSSEMLRRLRAKAAARGLEVEVVEGPADRVPADGFDAVIERHLVWTLPDPAATLMAWRTAAPDGRLILFESTWGGAADLIETPKAWARTKLRRLRKTPPPHHDEYSRELRAALPLGDGTPPGKLVEVVESSGWGPARLERLLDIEWSATQSLSGLDRLLGVTPRFAVIAG